jgi:hypothetical protein
MSNVCVVYKLVFLHAAGVLGHEARARQEKMGSMGKQPDS